MTTAAISQGVGQRVSAWLRQRWPVDTAKQAARAFDTSVHTTVEWLKGQTPANKHWHAMVALWGPRFVGFVYAPYFDWAEQLRLEAELVTLEAEADALREKLRNRDAQGTPRLLRAVAHEAPAETGGVVEGKGARPAEGGTARPVSRSSAAGRPVRAAGGEA